ncbi:MarR family winged helix-turn-helix transcriptional regulator [Erysipelotrichia bacterium]
MKKPAKDEFAALRLDNQLCFPLYAASRLVIKLYKPFLDRHGLTYTQYIAMMALWENDDVAVSELGDRLFLDSGTLTPLLKKLETLGFIRRDRDAADERTVRIQLTSQGKKLQKAVLDVPRQMASCVHLRREEACNLHALLHNLIKNLSCTG